MTTPDPDGPDVTLYCHPDDLARAAVAAVRAYGDDATFEVQPSAGVRPGRLVVVSRAALKDLLAGDVSYPPAADPVPVRHSTSHPLCGHPYCYPMICQISGYAWAPSDQNLVIITGV